tara:strand:+ start:457 stop:786 length:330 start_codon:yes stop_codon:yes gene_type:complete
METTLTKSLQKGSEYNQFDLDGDGTVTDEEIKRSQDMMELELREEKSEAQKKMAWVALGTMIVFTGILFTPSVSEGRVSALADLLGLFYIAQAGVVGAYMGVSAWMSRK